MEKTQIKPRKDKKKNTETGVLMGQNINVFSQLSATYLQNKSMATEDEECFVENTKIIEYHDPNINRLIALLRKKAEVTKVKAVVELREEVSKMTADDVEELIPTFAHLYMEIILNQPSKQVVEEFIVILTQILTDHKRILLKEINTLYGPMLISIKLPKIATLLFTGSQEQQFHKILLLLLKKQTKKKFFILMKIILECDSLDKPAQSYFQKNCNALLKVIKQIIKTFEKCSKREELEGDFQNFLEEVDELLSGKCVDEYFKIGGKPKASFLELYSYLVKLSLKYSEWNLNSEKYCKILGANFLDKDAVIQQTLWKYCNRQFIESLATLNQRTQKKEDHNYLLNIYLPKADQKLIQVLKLGGATMYKELLNFLTIFPPTLIDHSENHKSMINKIGLIRKIFITVLEQEDENQIRMQCYYNLSLFFITKIRQVKLTEDQKKVKEIHSLLSKLEKEVVENLQEKYYSNPPLSKNTFTYYIPTFIAQIIEKLNIQFDLKFDSALTFPLYKHLQSTNPNNHKYFDFIFQKCQGNFKLLVNYLENFPKKEVKLEFTLIENNQNIEEMAKIYLLSIQGNLLDQKSFIREEWNENIKLMIYDPRITRKDVEVEEEEGQEAIHNLQFRPINKNLPNQLYDQPNLDDIRFAYFQQSLINSSSVNEIRFLIPLLSDWLMPRNPQYLNKLLQIYQQKHQDLKSGKWIISLHEVTVIRVLATTIIDYLVKNHQQNNYTDAHLLRVFLENYCDFPRIMNQYKMTREVEQLLKKSNQLLRGEEYKNFLFASAKTSIKESYLQLLNKIENNLTDKQQKIRRNKLQKCTEFISKVLWYCIPRNNIQYTIAITKELLASTKGWKQADNRSEPWLIGYCLLEHYDQRLISKISKQVVKDHKEYVCSFGYLLSCQTVLSLQSHPNAKRLYLALQEQIIQLIIELEEGEQLELLKHQIEYTYNENSFLLSQGIQNLLKSVLKSQELLALNHLEKYSDVCLIQPFKMFIKPASSQNIYQSLIFINILSEFPLKNVSNTENIYNEVYEKLSSVEQGIDYLQTVAIACSFWTQSIGLDELELNQNNQNQSVMFSIIEKCFISMDQIYNKFKTDILLTNFATYSIFTLINTISPFGVQLFTKFEQRIAELFWSESSSLASLQGKPLHCITQISKLDYATKLLTRTKEEKDLCRLVSQISVLCLKQYVFYRQLLQQIDEEEDELEGRAPAHQNIISLFIHISQFIIRSTSILQTNVKPAEENILELIQCPFLALKKSSFILLKQMYQLKIVERFPPNLFLKLLQFQVPKQNSLNSQIAGEISTYLFIWQALLLRRQSTQRAPTSEEQQVISLEEYIQNSGCSDLFLRNIFDILDHKLQYLKNQSQFELFPEELLVLDYDVNFQDTGLEKKMFKMAMRTLFAFILNFPIFLRDFMDKNKKYKNLCDRLLRVCISDAIFKEEVNKIEIRELQWKTSGNFEIFVTPKNKEIYAEYTHEVIRIGLRLVMKGNYPLTPISIEFGEGLKMEDGSRWALMLQSQLHNRNNTIINGVMLWKENIDKKLAGVQECSICYDIVNASGQLPKKGCKTCKKKFHGNCIMKWFTKSNKSECPLCKSQFL